MYMLPHLYAEVSAVVYIAGLLCCVRDGLRRLCAFRHHQGPLLLVKLIPAQGKSCGAMGGRLAAPLDALNKTLPLLTRGGVHE